VDDYDIFFATQRLESKDTSGDKILARKPVAAVYDRRTLPSESNSVSPSEATDAHRAPLQRELLRDTHGHYVVQHDLFNHEGLTRDGIAEAFAEFGAKEHLSFF
jgi:type I restriction enzyme M protein